MTAGAYLRTLVAGLLAMAAASGASALDAGSPAAPGMQSAGAAEAAATGSAAVNSRPVLSVPAMAPPMAPPITPSTGAADGGGRSRLLRVLDGGAAGQPQRTGPGQEAWTPNGPVPETGKPAPATAASVIAGCPRDLLTRLLEGVAERRDMLSALAIEQEILKLCHERQLIVTGIFETEAQLRALRAPKVSPAENRSQAAAAVPSVVPQLNTAGAKPPVSATTARKPANAAPSAPSYGWFSIVGMTGDLRAGVTDGARVWFVREGDPLPGDVRVGRIAARPPGVQIEGSDGHALPYRARPGDGS